MIFVIFQLTVLLQSEKNIDTFYENKFLNLQEILKKKKKENRTTQKNRIRCMNTAKGFFGPLERFYIHL